MGTSDFLGSDWVGYLIEQHLQGKIDRLRYCSKIKVTRRKFLPQAGTKGVKIIPEV